MPKLEGLGWGADLAAALERLHDDSLAPARIVAQHRGAYVLWTEEDPLRATAAGKLFYEHDTGGQLPAVGDWVAVTPEGVITAILPRRSAIIRKDAGHGSKEQVLAANVDTVFLLAGLDDDLSLRRLERYLAVVWASGALPVVLLTKTDLCSDVAAALLAVEGVATNVPIHPISNLTGEGLEALEHYLELGRTVVLLGSSGVGKSTLLNRLAGQELMRTSELADDGTGQHTTIHRQLFQLPSGGLLIDTPGLRELQFWEGDLQAAFEDIEALALECRFQDCSHLSEPACAVQVAVKNGTLAPERLRSWRQLQRELEQVAKRSSQRLDGARKKRWQERVGAGER